MPQDLYFELHYDGVWNDITGDVRVRKDVAIRQGRQDEASNASPSTFSLQLNNRHGRYSPRNPRSPLFGKIGRNTPIRTRVGARASRLVLPEVESAYASTPDAAALDITGDLDLRIDVEPAAWRNPEAKAFARKFKFSTDELSWSWFLQPDGTVRLWWSPDGSDASRIRANSTVPVPEGGRQSVRVTLDVDNGAGVWEARFYTATTLDGPWTQLGDTVTGAAVTSLFASDQPVEIGRMGPDGFFDVFPLKGSVYGFQVRNGIDGTLVAGPDFTTVEAGDRSFTDSAGLVWSVNGPAYIEDLSVRMSGEVSEWPARWDLSGSDVTVPIVASGIRRRLSQGASPLSSALYRGITGGNITTPVAYWPCEDGKNATEFGSALGHGPMRIFGGTKVKPAAFGDFAASLPVPTVSTGGRFQGDIPAYPESNFLRSMQLVKIPDEGVSSEQNQMRLRTTGGTTEAWNLLINAAGDLRLVCFAHGGATLVDQTVVFNLNGASGLIWIYLVQNGADIDWQMGFGAVGAEGAGIASGTLAGHSFGRAHQVIVGQDFNLNDVTVGHVHVLHTDEFWEILNFAKAWDGDTAKKRITRLAAEENVPLTVGAGDTTTVGPQRPLTFLDLTDEAAEADLGILTDRRDTLALHYRPRESLYSQTPALTLDYAASDVSEPFEPVEDDEALRNDLTVNRVDGGSAQATQETGPLSIQPPPLGVGRYDASVDINVEDDSQLPDQAGWRLHLGTVDEARYPTVTVDLHANPHLIESVKAVEVGDRITITNPPKWLPPEMIDLIVQGYQEVLSVFVWTITFNCTPGSPWNVWVLEDPEHSRLDSAYSETTTSFVAGTDTALSVAGGRFEGFEPGDQVVVYTDGGDLGWVRDDTESHAGGWSLRSGAITSSQTSDAVVTVPDRTTHASFWYKVSSESGFDAFRFLIDGVEQFSASGEVAWTKTTYAVTPGQTLTFRYAKDTSVDGGQDAAWIDDLLLAGAEWETDPVLSQVPFDIQVSGVRLRVTAITGETSPQTFTVEQTPVNGVTKTIPAGERVRLTHRAVLAL
ncbi:hypothetical protein [Amycolatopsis palatopharyngis]|uniref:hypothetical protein n=1 Tax=Amycolatopsis palatopharyngis TaxID=187982 RepID=UPI000E24C415|nr:hypothetical protein [Amycolatopsis palatopharyngis]